MKDRFIKVAKWILITLGVLYLIQIIFISGAVVGLMSLAKADLTFLDTDKKTKDILPIIKYAEEYKTENGKYPTEIKDVKIKKGVNWKYETSKDNTCYTIKVENDDLKKEYKRCSISSDNSSSNTESYVEYND